MGISSLDAFAARHHGLVTRRAAVRAGLSERAWYRAIEAGPARTVHPGVCRMYGAPIVAGPADPRGRARRRARARWPRTARRRGCGGCPDPTTSAVDLHPAHPHPPCTVAGATVHRPRDLLDLNPSRKDGIRTTNILRTLCDLGAVDPAAVPGAVGHVVTTGMASPAALVAAIKRHGRHGRPGVPALREALGEWVLDGKPVDSVLEPAMRRLLDRHRLPPAEFHPRIGGYEVDFRVVDSPLDPGVRRLGDPRPRPSPVRAGPHPRRRPRRAGLRGAALHLPSDHEATGPRGRPDPPQRRPLGAPPPGRRRDRFPSGLPATPMGAWERSRTSGS